MNMKRILSLALMALLLCLPVWAMAATYDLSTFEPDSNNDIILYSENVSSLVDGDILTGTAPACRIIQTGIIPQNATLTLNNVYVEDGNLNLSIASNGTVTLNLLGNNYLSSTWGGGLEVHGKLIIPSRGKLGANAFNIIYGCDMILPDYYGPIPDGMSFTGWAVEINWAGTTELMQPGENLVCDEWVFIEPMFEEISDPIPQPSPDLPKTGDDSNVILWSALACISLFGMTMLVRKRKEA